MTTKLVVVAVVLLICLQEAAQIQGAVTPELRLMLGTDVIQDLVLNLVERTDSLHSALETTQHELKSTQVYSERTLHALRATRKELEATQAALKAAESNIEATQSKADAIQRETQDSQEQLKVNLAATQKELKETQAHLRATRGELKETKVELKEAKLVVEATQDDLRRTERRLQGMVVTEATQSALVATQTVLEATKAALDATQAEMKEIAAKVEVFKTSQAAAESDIKLVDLQKKIDSLSDELSSLTTKLTDFFARTSLAAESAASQGGKNSSPGQDSSSVVGAPQVGTFSLVADVVESGNSSATDDAQVSDQVHVLQIDATGGITYTRWGRKSCDDTSNVLYRGFASGAPLSAAGSGSDYLCLQSHPSLGVSISKDPYPTSLVGVEYRMTGDSPFSTINNYGHQLLHNDMPCTVCHIQTRTTQLMIPGRNECPAGWTREYWGYLVSSHPTHPKTSYMCLDNAPEAIAGGSLPVLGSLVYTVQAVCGLALPCPPYASGHAVACAVCTK